jgi:hypothetical protein
MGSETNGREAIDRTLAAKFISYAERFELAVKSGQEIVAIATARGLEQGVARFFPYSLSRYCSKQHDLNWFPEEPSDVHTSVDTHDLSAVTIAVAKFKDAIMSENIDTGIEALGAVGFFKNQIGPQRELRAFEIGLRQVTGRERVELLARAAKLAYWLGNANKATNHAVEILQIESPTEPSNNGEAIHDANMILGLLAIEQGDVGRAKEHLLASTQGSITGGMQFTGPNMTLADKLLSLKENQVVIKYLLECRRFWETGNAPIDAWVETIRNGKIPDLDPIHLAV